MTSIKHLPARNQEKFLKKVLRVARKLGITTRKDTKYELQESGFTNHWRLNLTSDSKNNDYSNTARIWLTMEFNETCVGLEKRNKLRLVSGVTSPAGCSVGLNLSAHAIDSKPEECLAKIKEILVEYLKQYRVRLTEVRANIKDEKARKVFKQKLGITLAKNVGKGRNRTWVPENFNGRRTDVTVNGSTAQVSFYNIPKNELVVILKAAKSIRKGKGRIGY
jgi:hypothetical protein